MVKGGTSRAVGMVHHVLHTSSLNDLRAILPVLAAEKHGCDVYIYTFNDPSIVLTYIMLTISSMQ